MKPINILHLADIHLDSKIEGLGEKKSLLRRNELMLSFKNAINKFNETDIVLISGDLFDGIYNKSTVKYLCKLISEYSEKHFFLAAGNHDSLSSEPMRHLIDEKPNNLHVFDEKTTFVEIESMGVRVYGISFGGDASYTSLLHGFSAKKDSMVNIMLMHGEVASQSKYNPISIDEIEKSGLDYLALGHIHKFSEIKKIGSSYYAYPGTLEPHGFDECGDCGVIYGKISKDLFDLKFYPVSLRKYCKLCFDISDISSDAELVERLSEKLNSDNIYRITLIGNKTYTPNISVLSELIDVFHCEIIDNSRFQTSVFDYADENSLVGIAASQLNNYLKTGNYSEKEINDAADILTSLLIGGDVK